MYLPHASAAHRFSALCAIVLTLLCPAAWAVSLDRVFFLSEQSGNREVWSVDESGGNLLQHTFTPSIDELYARVSPDGRFLATGAPLTSSSFPSGIYLVDIDGTNHREILTGVNRKRGLFGFSPDGTALVFDRQRSDANFEDSDLWRADLDGSNLLRLTTSDANIYGPDWSIDGQIAYANAVKFVAGSAFIEITTDDGTDVRTSVVNLGGNDEFPRWSHDGQWLLFSSESEGAHYKVRPDGSDLTQLFTGGVHGSWSTDDAWIAFTRQGNIWLVDADGTNERQITFGANDFRVVDVGVAAPVPEPGLVGLLSLGLVVGARLRRRTGS